MRMNAQWQIFPLLQKNKVNFWLLAQGVKEISHRLISLNVFFKAKPWIINAKGNMDIPPFMQPLSVSLGSNLLLFSY